ncbi:MAG: LysE family translocator [Xanthobacteraceae bacterium]|nr:LysE family translocator [Xanthobacteraceae bacterium]PWB57843.1 MAG: lysine transporter LysE [Bradyrhizobiaceae bacterium]
MDPAALAVFAVALFVAAASPGPGIAAIVARVLGRGTSGALAFTAGVAIGDVVWLTFAVLGLAVVAQTFHGVFLAIKYLGAAYLLYLAWKLWTTPAVAADLAVAPSRERPAALFLGGLAVTMGNPKVMVFYLALLPHLLDLGRITLLGYAELVALTLAILAIVFGGYVALAARARRLLRSPRAMRLVNRGTGTLMAGAAVAVAAR